MRYALIIFLVILSVAVSGCVQNNINQTNQTVDRFTVMNEINVRGVSIKWLGHASFQITNGKKFVYIDPYVLPANPEKADYILITHEHFDHCDVKNIEKINRKGAEIIGHIGCISKINGTNTNSIEPDESFSYDDGVRAAAVEAYNVDKFRSPGQVFHPQGLGVGFVLTIDGVKIYHAGDTDNIPEMTNLQNQGIDVALLPIGGTYTMTVSEAAEAAQVIKPKILIPMHYNSDKYGVSGINANPVELAKALVGKGIVVNILEHFV